MKGSPIQQQEVITLYTSLHIYTVTILKTVLHSYTDILIDFPPLHSYFGNSMLFGLFRGLAVGGFE